MYKRQVRQVVMARQGHSRAFSDDLRRHLSDHLLPCSFPPLGVFTQVGLTQPFWINLVIYLFAVGGLGFPNVVWHVASRCDSRPVCHPDPQINRVSAIWL